MPVKPAEALQYLNNSEQIKEVYNPLPGISYQLIMPTGISTRYGKNLIRLKNIMQKLLLFWNQHDRNKQVYFLLPGRKNE